MSVMVNIESGIHITKMTTNNTISNGINVQFGWSSHQKRIYIYHVVGNDNHVDNNYCQVIDNDNIDYVTLGSSNMSGNMYQSF